MGTAVSGGVQPEPGQPKRHIHHESRVEKVVERIEKVGKVLGEGSHVARRHGLSCMHATVSSDDFSVDFETREKELCEKENDWRANEKYGLVTSHIAKGLDRLFVKYERWKDSKNDLVGNYRRIGKGDPIYWSDESQVRCTLYAGKALNALYHPEEFENQRAAYKEYKECLRAALKSDYYKDEPNSRLAGMLNIIAFAEHALVSVQGFTESIANKSAAKGGFIPTEYIPKEGETLRETQLGLFETRLNDLSSFHHTIEDSAETLATLRGEIFSWGLDSTVQGNPINVKFKIENANGREITNIRTPTPTGKDGEVTLEFKAFLRELKRQGLKYTMINLQNRRMPGIGRRVLDMTGECQRSRNLEALQKDPEFKDMFTCFTLDKNSAFFEQSEVTHDVHAEVFKVQFLLEMKNPESGFHLPQSFTYGEKAHEIEQLFNDIHKDFFGNRENLAQKERQDFIEVAYIFLADYFIKETGASYYNESCKDCIDRGGGANFTMMAFLTVLEIYDPNRKHKKSSPVETRIANLPADLEADAIWARKRPVKEDRLERAEGALDCIIKAFEENPGLAKKWGDKINFKKIIMNADESQATKDPKLLLDIKK